MQITIKGQTIETFIVVVEDETKRVEYNINTELVVADDLERETRDAAAKEHFWNQIALTAQFEAEEFEKTFYTTYTAHTERYAGFYLKGQGEKTSTGTAKEKAATLLFSENADKRDCAQKTYIGYRDSLTKVGLTVVSETAFYDEMYAYDDDMEGIERQLLALKHKASQLRAISAAFNTKSWSIKTMAADRRAMMQSGI